MRPGDVVSLQRMKAWWTYTEFSSVCIGTVSVCAVDAAAQ
jgi:hypothetical protein